MKKDYVYFRNRAEQLLNRQWGMLIDGEMVPAMSGKVMDTLDPSTQRVIAQVPFAQKEDVDRAVEAAFQAFETWRKIPVKERVGYIHQIISIIKAHKEDLALLDALNSGNSLQGMLKDVDLACDVMSFLAGAALNVTGQTIPSTEKGWHFTIREPYGVVGRIIPFNHPFMFAATKIVAPIVMGNCIVLKAPDQDPLACLYFAELIKDVLPPGVVNIITGDGMTGQQIVQHPRIKRISLIGSVPTGLKVQQAAAQIAVKHVSLELGGKNPMIVFPDANLDKAVYGVIQGMNFLTVQGQSCGSTSRLFLHESIHDQFIEKLLAEMEVKIKLGIPIDPEVNMGCLVSKPQYDKVMYYISEGQKEGAKLVYGGKHPDAPELQKGFFVEPTVFTQVSPHMKIAQDEIFGPVVSVFTWREEEQVLKMANDTQYGLTASVWTQDINRVVRFAKELQAGVVWINQTAVHYTGMPFSGYKNSGLDSEESIEELYSFTQLKTINVMTD